MCKVSFTFRRNLREWRDKIAFSGWDRFLLLNRNVDVLFGQRGGGGNRKHFTSVCFPKNTTRFYVLKICFPIIGGRHQLRAQSLLTYKHCEQQFFVATPLLLRVFNDASWFRGLTARRDDVKMWGYKEEQILWLGGPALDSISRTTKEVNDSGAENHFLGISSSFKRRLFADCEDGPLRIMSS